MDLNAKKHEVIGLAAIEDGSEEAKKVFEKSFEALAQMKSLAGAASLAILCETLGKSGVWPNYEPLECFLEKNESKHGKSLIDRLTGYSKMSFVLIQMSAAFGDEVAGMSKNQIKQCLDECLSVCLKSRWERLERFNPAKRSEEIEKIANSSLVPKEYKIAAEQSEIESQTGSGWKSRPLAL